MKKFSDLKIGDKIYLFNPLNGIKPFTIIGIRNLYFGGGGLIFDAFAEGKYKYGEFIYIGAKNIGKSISIPNYFSKFIDFVIITNPKIAEWFDL